MLPSPYNLDVHNPSYKIHILKVDHHITFFYLFWKGITPYFLCGNKDSQASENINEGLGRNLHETKRHSFTREWNKKGHNELVKI